MMPAHPDSRALLPVLSKLSSHTIDLDRAASPLLALAFLVSIGFAGVTAVRIARIEREQQPALETARQLVAPLDATRALLRNGRLGPVESRMARADSLAQRFHHLASGTRLAAEQRAQVQDYDARFGEYYVAARRAAAGTSMSLDADGSSAEDASLGYAMLRENLAAGIETREQAIDAARPATAPIELAAWLAMALLSVAALLRRLTGRQQTEQARVTDDYTPIQVGDGTSAIRLHDAVERLARKRLAASIAAARVAKRNNERQIELARTWNTLLSIVPPTAQPTAEMDVYVDEEAEVRPTYGRLTLVSA